MEKFNHFFNNHVNAILGIQLSIIYAFPLGFLGIYYDFYNNSNLGYLMMIILMGCFAYIGGYLKNSVPLFIGNVISIVSSIYFLEIFKNQPNWDIFFTTIPSMMLITIFTVISIVAQVGMFKMGKYFRLKKSSSDFDSTK